MDFKGDRGFFFKSTDKTLKGVDGLDKYRESVSFFSSENDRDDFIKWYSYVTKGLEKFKIDKLRDHETIKKLYETRKSQKEFYEYLEKFDGKL